MHPQSPPSPGKTGLGRLIKARRGFGQVNWCSREPAAVVEKDVLVRWVPVQAARSPSVRELCSPDHRQSGSRPTCAAGNRAVTQQEADLGQNGFSPPLPKDRGNTTITSCPQAGWQQPWSCRQQPWPRCRRAPSSQARLRSLLWRKRPQAGTSSASLTMRCGGTR